MTHDLHLYTIHKREVPPLTTQTLQKDRSMLNAIVLVDYENIFELLKRYGKDPLEIDFFKVIKAKLKEEKLDIIDFIVYGNFEKKTSAIKQQTQLRTMGLQTRQASTNGKNSGDLELTVDALRALYKNPGINVFVIISSDRDIIPLLKAIKYESRVSYVLSTKNGFNQVVAEYADFHEYLEDIFGLTAPPAEEMKAVEEVFDLLFADNINEGLIERAREVSHYLYESNIWKKSCISGEPVSLVGFINVVAKVVSRLKGDLFNDFKVAHHLKYITIYTDQENRLYLREGESKGEAYNKPDNEGG